MLIKFMERWRAYEEGKTYNVGDGVAKIHISQGRAIKVNESDRPKLRHPPKGRKKPTTTRRKNSGRRGSGDNVRVSGKASASGGGDGSPNDSGGSSGSRGRSRKTDTADVSQDSN